MGLCKWLLLPVRIALLAFLSEMDLFSFSMMPNQGQGAGGEQPIIRAPSPGVPPAVFELPESPVPVLQVPESPPVAPQDEIPNPVHADGDQGGEIPNPAQAGVAQDDIWNILDQPLLDEGERHNQLTNILLPRLSPDELSRFNDLYLNAKVQTFANFEISLERGLRNAGYLPETINHCRGKIREIVFFSNSNDGSLLKESTLNSYLFQMERDFLGSTPYRKLLHAKENYNLNLYKPGDPLFYLYQNL